MTRLTAALSHILRNYGHDILLQRRTGKSYTKKLERHTVRHWYPATRGLPQTVQDAIEGQVLTVDMIYAFEGAVRPKEMDRIYEKDEGLGQQAVFKIDYSLPMRGMGGKIVFWVAGATREDPQ